MSKDKVIIRYMETDKDHIHYMIETEPTMSISKIIFGKNIRIIYENISGKNILFGRTDILSAV
jgi:REP element-mobilizing transposase RayT